MFDCLLTEEFSDDGAVMMGRLFYFSTGFLIATWRCDQMPH